MLKSKRLLFVVHKNEVYYIIEEQIGLDRVFLFVCYLLYYRAGNQEILPFGSGGSAIMVSSIIVGRSALPRPSFVVSDRHVQHRPEPPTMRSRCSCRHLSEESSQL